jgi:hypothetical protein
MPSFSTRFLDGGLRFRSPAPADKREAAQTAGVQHSGDTDCPAKVSHRAAFERLVIDHGGKSLDRFGLD